MGVVVTHWVHEDVTARLAEFLGSAVDDVRREMGLAAAAQVRDALAGRYPEGAITPPPRRTQGTGQARR